MARPCCRVAALVLATACAASATQLPLPRGYGGDCKLHWHTQRLDHFRWRRGGQQDGAVPQPTFQQRVFVCDRHWRRRGAPIFFYAGNEGPVEGYMRATGLMFEHARDMGAALVFAEHRYYGDSQPFARSGGGEAWRVDPSYLTSEQALADYAALLDDLTRAWDAQDSPVIAFGGSYGGMLAAWLRREYPHLVAGAVAASAPLGQFPGSPGFRPAAFWEVVTRDATPAAGAAPGCARRVRAAFAALLDAGRSQAGREELARVFRLCQPLRDEADATRLAYWAQGAFDAFAMGNYHFATDYMTSPGHELPAWPMRAACERVMAGAAAGAPARRLLLRQLDGGRREALLASLRDAAALLYNVTRDVACFRLDLSGPAAGSSGAWDYAVCTEFLGQELPYFPAGTSSMFWDQGPFDAAAIQAHCARAWGVTPDWRWALVRHGGVEWSSVSNVAFTNGLLDPWSAFGVLRDASPSVVAVTIPDGAHHSDLMFSRDDDSAALRAARRTVMAHVQRWVHEHVSARAAGTRCAPEGSRLPGAAPWPRGSQVHD